MGRGGLRAGGPLGTGLGCREAAFLNSKPTNGHRVSVWDDEQVPEPNSGNGGTTRSTYLTPLNCTLKSD